MSYPGVANEFETFFEPTRIWLFGKEFKSLKYHPASMGKWPETPEEERTKPYWSSGTSKSDGPGEFSEYFAEAGKSLPIPPRRLERTLRRGFNVTKEGVVTDSEGAAANPQVFARIYSFSYEAHYYRLPRPLLFLVKGTGTPVGGVPGKSKSSRDLPRGARAGEARRGSPAATEEARRAEQEQLEQEQIWRSFTAKHTGVEARDWSFSNDICVWPVDRKDLAICLDIEIGNYQEILLDSMIGSDRRDEDRATRSRGDVIGRGAGSFRGDMIGPHQNK
jgi:hypothetical protein